MSSNTERLTFTRRAIVACLAVGALVAVASDASAAPLTDADFTAFAAGPIKHVVGSPLNSRIPQGATSSGFRLTLTRGQSSVEVKTVGEVFVPPHSYVTLERRNGDGIWQQVVKQYPGGFVRVNRTDLTTSAAEGVSIRNVAIPGAQSCDLQFVFNAASNPKSVLVTVTHNQDEYGSYNPGSTTRPKALAATTSKPLGGAFVYTVRPDGGGA